MKLWDHNYGRLAEFGIDIRGGRLHRLLGHLAIWLELSAHTDGVAMKAGWRSRAVRRLSCACEACLREFLPWPFSW